MFWSGLWCLAVQPLCWTWLSSASAYNRLLHQQLFNMVLVYETQWMLRSSARWDDELVSFTVCNLQGVKSFRECPVTSSYNTVGRFVFLKRLATLKDLQFFCCYFWVFLNCFVLFENIVDPWFSLGQMKADHRGAVQPQAERWDILVLKC